MQARENDPECPDTNQDPEGSTIKSDPRLPNGPRPDAAPAPTILTERDAERI